MEISTISPPNISSSSDEYAENKLKRLKRIRLLKQRRSSSLSEATQQRISRNNQLKHQISSVSKADPNKIPKAPPVSVPLTPPPQLLTSLLSSTFNKHSFEANKKNKLQLKLDGELIDLNGADPLPSLTPSAFATNSFFDSDSDDSSSSEFECKSEGKLETIDFEENKAARLARRSISLPEHFDDKELQPHLNTSITAFEELNLNQIQEKKSEEEEEEEKLSNHSFNLEATSEQINNVVHYENDSKDQDLKVEEPKTEPKDIENTNESFPSAESRTWAFRCIVNSVRRHLVVIKIQVFRKWSKIVFQANFEKLDLHRRCILARQKDDLVKELQNVIATARRTSARFAQDKLRHIFEKRIQNGIKVAFNKWSLISCLSKEFETLRCSQEKIRRTNVKLQDQHYTDMLELKTMSKVKRRIIVQFMFYRWKIWYQGRLIEMQNESIKKEREYVLKEVLHIHGRVENLERKSFTKFLVQRPKTLAQTP